MQRDRGHVYKRKKISITQNHEGIAVWDKAEKRVLHRQHCADCGKSKRKVTHRLQDRPYRQSEQPHSEHFKEIIRQQTNPNRHDPGEVRKCLNRLNITCQRADSVILHCTKQQLAAKQHQRAEHDSQQQDPHSSHSEQCSPIS